MTYHSKAYRERKQKIILSEKKTVKIGVPSRGPWGCASNYFRDVVETTFWSRFEAFLAPVCQGLIGEFWRVMHLQCDVGTIFCLVDPFTAEIVCFAPFWTWLKSRYGGNHALEPF